MGETVTRFAPSPTGPLHLGHAYAAFIAAGRGQRFLLRIEDIDRARSKPQFEAEIYEDLQWLGLNWQGPVLRQSDRLSLYADAVDRLTTMGLTYHCQCTRGDIKAALSAPQEGAPLVGPDGPVYPGTCRGKAHEAGAIRLDMAKAMAKIGAISFTETAHDPKVYHYQSHEMIANIGDVVLARKDIGTSYHIAVVVDDAAQGITEVTRGADLFEATAIHVLLQKLLGYPTPLYHHHALIRDDQGKRLAKRDDARAISKYREDGLRPQDIRALLGL